MTAAATDASPGYTRDWPVRAGQVLAALPEGTIEAARRSLQRGLHLFGAETDKREWLTEASLAQRLVAPLLVGDEWPLPSAPLPVGNGAVHADLTDEDHEVFAGLRSALAGQDRAADPERLSAAAQEIRLPVTPYRPLPRRQPPSPSPGVAGNGSATSPPSPHHPTGARSSGQAPEDRSTGPPDAPLVLDLSALWAGPLTTSLLAELGARVIKIDPHCRPDGLRRHPAMYETLNANKTVVDLDLRNEPDRAHFETLLGDADLVVDSFSRRVMPNFGYGPDDLLDRYPRLSTLSIVAFPAGSPEQHWVSYGPGVHAASGLAMGPASDHGPPHDGRSRATPAPIAYPDALAGLSAFAAAAELLSGTPGDHVEISLASALEPLVNRALAAHDGGDEANEAKA